MTTDRTGSGGLAATQATLADVLRRATSLKGDPDLVARAERIASGNDRLSPVEQVDIYREQFWLRHVDVLREDFASIEHALGEEAFERLAKDYLTACPSASFSLRDLGVDMPRFLAESRPWSDDPFLAELARVEWAFVDVFDGRDAPPFDPATIAGVAEEAWPGARLVLHPALQRLSLRWPAHDYRIAVRKDEVPVRPESRSCHVVVYRGPSVLHCLEIDGDAAAMLDELARGVPLGEACERAAGASGSDLATFEGKLAGWFSEWTALGWIRAVRFETSG
jgi:Putative DNA-binding domain